MDMDACCGGSFIALFRRDATHLLPNGGILRRASRVGVLSCGRHRFSVLFCHGGIFLGSKQKRQLTKRGNRIIILHIGEKPKR